MPRPRRSWGYDEAYSDLTELIEQSRSSGDYRDLIRLTNLTSAQPSRDPPASSLDNSSDQSLAKSLEIVTDTADELNHAMLSPVSARSGPRGRLPIQPHQLLLSPYED